MSWVKEALKQLSATGTCQVRPIGGSMRGRIESGQLVTIIAIEGKEVALEDAIFLRWKGNYLIHLAKEITEDKILIGNNIGKINGWIDKDQVIGKVIEVAD